MLNETIRMMAEIDQAIEAHGGWPAAFETASEPADTQLFKLFFNHPDFRR